MKKCNTFVSRQKPSWVQLAFPISCWLIPPSTSVVQVSPCFLPSQIKSLLNWHLALSVHWGVWGGLTGPAWCLFDWRGFVPHLIGFVSLSDSPTNWLRVETTPDTCSPTNKYLHVAEIRPPHHVFAKISVQRYPTRYCFQNAFQSATIKCLRMSVEYFSPFSFAPVLIGGKVNGHKTPALFFMCSSHFDCPTSPCSEFLNPKGIHENQDGVSQKWLRFSLGIIVALEIVITQPLCMPGRSICKASAYLIIWYHNPHL